MPPPPHFTPDTLDLLCTFLEKARYIESQGAKAGIVVDSNPKTTSAGNPLFAMSGDGTDDVSLLSFQFLIG